MPPWLHRRVFSQWLQRDELAGVIAHELAHIQNRDILISSIAATVAAAIISAEAATATCTRSCSSS